MPDYGSPKAGDPTSEIERQIENVTQQAVKIGLRQMKHILNRAPGTVETKPEDLHFDWKTRQPDYWPSLFQKLSQQGFGQEEAVFMLLKHDQEQKELGDA